jgi:hypothetical protein
VLSKQYSGVDFAPYAEDLTEPGELNKSLGSGKFFVHWMRCWMGLRLSPFMAVRFYYLAEEFAQGNRWAKRQPTVLGPNQAQSPWVRDVQSNDALGHEMG